MNSDECEDGNGDYDADKKERRREGVRAKAEREGISGEGRVSECQRYSLERRK